MKRQINENLEVLKKYVPYIIGAAILILIGYMMFLNSGVGEVSIKDDINNNNVDVVKNEQKIEQTEIKDEEVENTENDKVDAEKVEAKLDENAEGQKAEQIEELKEQTKQQPTEQPKVEPVKVLKEEKKAEATQSKPEVTEVKIPEQKSKPLGLEILKNDITSTAKFYPYQAGDTYMEVLAVKASDGSVRTALNTCQVCYDSGRGYYLQEGDELICQNCKNRFAIDKVELIKGGCNPVPITLENKTEDGNMIFISKEYLESNKQLFSKWKR